MVRPAFMLLMLANLVLQDAIERIFVGDIYGDIYAGIYVIRGENVVLLGEIVRTDYCKC
jgi:U6 snRNA-associated Sm-like protein LSm1